MSSSATTRARPPLERPQLVEDAVLRHLEQPRREPRADGEAGQALVDAQEDLLRQVLGEGAVADEAQDVVVDGLLVRPHDERERPLVAALGLAEHTVIRLRSANARRAYAGAPDSRTIYEFVKCHRFVDQRAIPVIAAGVRARAGRARSARGRRDRRRPPDATPSRVTISGTGFVVCAVCGLMPSSSSSFSALPWSAVTRQTPPRRVRRGRDDAPRQASARLDGADDGGIDAGVPDHVRVREVDDAERVAVVERRGDLRRDLRGGHLRLEVVARDVARRRHEDPRLPRPRAPRPAVEEVRHVGVLLRLRRVELPEARPSRRPRPACRSRSARGRRPGTRCRPRSGSS